MMIKVLVLIVILMVCGIAFRRLYPPFGAKVTGRDRDRYKSRTTSDYYDGARFYYPKEWRREGLTEDVRLSEKGSTPLDRLPVVRPDITDLAEITDETDVTDITNVTENADIQQIAVTWFGHSTILIRMHGKNILIDPVFCERASMFRFIGPKRFTKPPLTIGELPHIDICLISHDHYDHLDMRFIKQIADKTGHFLVPLGIEKHLIKKGIAAEKITDMAWWEAYEFDGLTFVCTPGLHMSNRLIDDVREKLWCSWVIKDAYHQIYESGDTGYGGHFQEIGQRYGEFDLVMLDCAQYNKKWHTSHMYPEESAMAAVELGAKTVMPIHWGAFALSSHGWDDPVERYVKAAREKGLDLVTPKPGETMTLRQAERFKECWWREYR